MKQLIAIAGLVLCLYSTVWAGEELASFSGTWIHNLKKSDAAPRLMNSGPPPVGDVSYGGGGFGGMPPGGGPGGFGPLAPSGKSGPGAKGPQTPQQLPPMTIDQSESEIRITTIMKGMGGKEMPFAEIFKLDGKDLVEMVPGMTPGSQVKKTTKVTLKKNKLSVVVETAAPQGTSTSKREYTLSKDGKILTMEVTNNMGMTSIQKFVYDKQ